MKTILTYVYWSCGEYCMNYYKQLEEDLNIGEVVFNIAKERLFAGHCENEYNDRVKEDLLIHLIPTKGILVKK